MPNADARKGLGAIPASALVSAPVLHIDNVCCSVALVHACVVRIVMVSVDLSVSVWTCLFQCEPEGGGREAGGRGGAGRQRQVVASRGGSGRTASTQRLRQRQGKTMDGFVFASPEKEPAHNVILKAKSAQGEQTLERSGAANLSSIHFNGTHFGMNSIS